MTKDTRRLREIFEAEEPPNAPKSWRYSILDIKSWQPRGFILQPLGGWECQAYILGLACLYNFFFNVCVLRIAFFGGLAALSFLGSFRIFPDGHETLLPSDFGRCSLLSSVALGSRGCFLEWPEIGSGGCCKSAEVCLVSSSFVWKVSFFHHTSVAVLLAALLLLLFVILVSFSCRCRYCLEARSLL